MRLHLIASVSILLVARSSVGHAQAWVGESDLTASVSYTFGMSDRILQSDGLPAFEGYEIYHHLVTPAVEYVLVDGLAIEGSLAMVGSELGDYPTPHEPAPGEWDDGDLHATITDARAGIRYQIIEAPVAVAVSLGGSIPTHDYPTFGSAAPGRGLMAAEAGVAIGYSEPSWLPRAYVYAQYSFSLVERFETDDPATEEFDQNHSDVSFRLGYLVLDNLDVNAGLDWRKAHGGFDFADWEDVSLGVQMNHDALLREDVLALAIASSYALTEKFSLGAGVSVFLSGRNTRDANLFGLTAAYSL